MSSFPVGGGTVVLWHSSAGVVENGSMRIQAQAVPGRTRLACVLVAIVAVAAICGPTAATAAPKTDVVVLRNGDRITGEIKSLDYNQLKLSTDHMGTIYIEWDKIERVQTDQYLLLERSDGSRAYGQLAGGGSDARLLVRSDPAGPPVPIAMAEVVRARPIEGGDFIDRLDGYVSAGFDLSNSGNNTTLDLAGGLSSRTRVREWSVDGSASITDDTATRAERYSATGTMRRPLHGQNYYEGQLSLLRNTELDLNVRALFAGALGRYLVRTNRAEWTVGAGLAYNRENYQGADPTDSVELLFGTEFSIFRYDFPETDIGGAIYVLPSLTQSGRYRSEADLHANYEFVDDLYFELRLYGSYDSEPPSPKAPSSDYGVTTSLGYKF